MAIGFARVEFVKRSAGKNACAKAAYNSRSEIEFEGTDHANSKTYDWSDKPDPAYHDILLPDHVDAKFKDPETLWNAVETKEVKSNAQVAIEVVLALPDDKVISLEDKIHLTRTFVQWYYVDQGLGAQIDIHASEPLLIFTRDNAEMGIKKGMRGDVISRTEDKVVVELEPGCTVQFNPQEFTGFIEKEHNWHAHVLVTTRRFKSDGLELEDGKARDMMPRINKGKVIAGPDWGRLWAEHQNDFFQEKGIDLRVDTNGLVPQEHLGPHRMRGRAFSMFEEHHRRIELNKIGSQDPEMILEAITSQKSVFTREDVISFLSKHTPVDAVESVSKNFWQQPALVQLADKRTGELIPKFTSHKVLEEEQQILRIADRICEKDAHPIKPRLIETHSNGLNPEQKKAFQGVLLGKRLSLVHGYAGTGKSHLLKALQTTYEEAGYRIRALGPDNATVDVLKEKGLNHTENVYRFLYALHNDRRKVLHGKEVWILDEAGKLGNRPLLEFLREAEKKGAHVILSGDTAQLPPVERGGMFKIFCDQYGSQVLEDIQRQKTERHREIARSLATGEFGAAIDKLSDAQGVRWAGNKKEAMEELILRWSRDTRSYSQSSTLIVAHSNAEVKVLNELVRLIRRQRGELGDKEFQCSTFQGNIYVSVGDRLEFRSNDKQLGLTNGLSGTLIEAEADRFVVSIQADGKNRQTVVFNPQEYHAFQLGYASTYYRSQGRTIDRAYVLHSSMMNKEMFYVGLTRHIKDVNYFVSKDEVYCLADLKRMAHKVTTKDLTVNYTTQEEVNAQKESLERSKEIQGLKQSDSILNKMKGYGLAALDGVLNKVGDVTERIQDRFPDPAFYKPTISDAPKELYSVVEMAKEALLQDQQSRESVAELPSENHLSREAFSSARLFDKLTSQQKPLAEGYFNAVGKASTLKFIVDAETESTARDVRVTAHFKEWQEACGSRNKAAYELLQIVPPKELEKTLDSKLLNILQEQASRYEFFLERKETTKQPIDNQLKAHLEPLLYRLYPEGPVSRDRTNFRFGNKGSLSVVHSGSKAGQFYDFEQQAGGGLMKLIQSELGLGKVEARAWAQDFLGIASDISVPRTFLKPSKSDKAEDTWVSLRPDPTVPAPNLEDLRGKKLGLYFNEVDRHAYKDANGELLYYVLRLKDKNDPGKKITPPLSYGYWKSDPAKVGWELKGFHDDKRSLYNLQLLKDDPRSTILIVEGEKTANQALKNLAGESYICMTWPGGAGAVQKADWTPLQGRKVLVWPDNDQPGYDAAERVCSELKKVGVESLHLVNKEDLKRQFPEKWDLADPLPAGASVHIPQKLIASALQKGIDPVQILNRLSLDAKDPIQKARANEVLWRVDERLRPGLEEKHGVQFWKINEEILKETSRIFLDQNLRKDELRAKFEVDGAVLERLNYQISIVEAQQGRKLKMGEINVIKGVIREHGHVQMSKVDDKRMADFVIDKTLMVACDRGLNGYRNLSAITSRDEVATTTQQVQKQVYQEMDIQEIHKKDIGRDVGNSIKI